MAPASGILQGSWQNARWASVRYVTLYITFQPAKDRNRLGCLTSSSKYNQPPSLDSDFPWRRLSTNMYWYVQFICYDLHFKIPRYCSSRSEFLRMYRDHISHTSEQLQSFTTWPGPCHAVELYKNMKAACRHCFGEHVIRSNHIDKPVWRSRDYHKIDKIDKIDKIVIRLIWRSTIVAREPSNS